MSSNNDIKVGVEVLCENNIQNLTAEIQDSVAKAVQRQALEAGSDVPSDVDVSDSVGTVVTGVSPKRAIGIIKHAVGEAGVDTNWNGSGFDVYKPNTEKVLGWLKDGDSEYESDSSMERDAYRQAANFRTKVLCEGTDDRDAVDVFVLIHDADGASRSARAFADNVLEHGGVLVQHAVEGVAPDEAEDDAVEEDASDSEEAPTPSAEDDEAGSSDDQEVMDEFGDLVDE